MTSTQETSPERIAPASTVASIDTSSFMGGAIDALWLIIHWGHNPLGRGYMDAETSGGRSMGAEGGIARGAAAMWLALTLSFAPAQAGDAAARGAGASMNSYLPE